MRLLLSVGLACLLAAVMLMTQPVFAHGGGLDARGCHNDNKAGTYHCHKGSCAGQTFASKSAAASCHL